MTTEDPNPQRIATDELRLLLKKLTSSMFTGFQMPVVLAKIPEKFYNAVYLPKQRFLRKIPKYRQERPRNKSPPVIIWAKNN